MANALEAASLVMIPSGYEDGTLGSLKPTDGSGDFTFSRGSNLSATRINEQGYIEKGYENLLLQSNTFSDAAWVKSNLLTPTNGYLGYDGSNDAWKLVPNAGTDSRVRQSFSTSGIITTSFYAKAAEWNYVGIYIFGSNKGVVWSLIDGSVQNPIIAYPEIYSNGENIGNGWWRFSITHNAVSGDIRIWPCEQNIYNGNTPDSVSGIYIQDAMLNQGLVAYPYIETTTAPVAGGILENEPRIDFSDGCGHLLLEPSRTNLIPYSEYIGTWGNEGSIVTLSDELSPEGVQNAYKHSLPATAGLYRLNVYTSTSTTIGTYTISGFFKSDGYDYVVIRIGTIGGSYKNASFNISNGTLDFLSASFDSYSIENYPNGWYRCSVTFTTDTTTISSSFRTNYESISNDNVVFNGGDGVSGMLLYGAQLEQDATYPTSYIPTYGVSQTRLVDNVNLLNAASFIGQTEGSYFIEWTAQQSDELYSMFNLTDGTNNNRVQLSLNDSGTTPRLGFIYVVNGTTGYSNVAIQNLVEGQTYKFAVAYTESSLIAYLDGTQVINQTGLSLSGGVFNQISYSLKEGSSFKFSKPVKQTIIFPTALSDSECIALTTI